MPILGSARPVRRALASNSSAPPQLLLELASDPSLAARVARNPNADAAVLARLALSPNPVVQAAVAKNLRSTCEILRRVLDEAAGPVRDHAQLRLSRECRGP